MFIFSCLVGARWFACHDFRFVVVVVSMSDFEFVVLSKFSRNVLRDSEVICCVARFIWKRKISILPREFFVNTCLNNTLPARYVFLICMP